MDLHKSKAEYISDCISPRGVMGFICDYCIVLHKTPYDDRPACIEWRQEHNKKTIAVFAGANNYGESPLFWASIADGRPALGQHLVNVSCLLGRMSSLNKYFNIYLFRLS